MRATRAYLAGFGTSGSLLAGAALMFVLASAFVAFHGWPQVAGQSAPASVSIPRSDVPAASRASRVLTGTVAGNTPTAPVAGHARRALAGASTRGSHTSFRVHHANGHTTVTPVSRTPGTTHSPGGTNRGSNPGTTHRTCTSNCGGQGSNGGTVGTVKHTVTGAGSTANSTVGQTVTTVKKVVHKVTGGSGSAVNNTGSTVGNVVTTTKKVVNGITHGLP